VAGTRYIWLIADVYNQANQSNVNNDYASTTFAVSLTSPGAFTINVASSCNGSAAQNVITRTNSSNATSYEVYRNGSLIYPNLYGTTFTNTSVVAGATYTYMLRAKNSAGQKDSNTVSINTTTTCGAATPGAFTISVASSCNGNAAQNVITRTNSSNATSYEVYRNGSLIYPNLYGTTFTNVGVSAGVTYSYNLRAKNAIGTVYSNTVTIATTSSCGTGSLAFPLEGFDAYRNGLITSVFDHSIGGNIVEEIPTDLAYEKDSVVYAYNGESGRKDYGYVCENESVCSYAGNQSQTFVFNLDGNYKPTAENTADKTLLSYDGHPGIDFGVMLVTVLAAADGKVFEVAETSQNGKYLVIEHDIGTAKGLFTFYLHLDSWSSGVVAGSRVYKGMPIGISGKIGNTSTGYHLHFQVRKGSRYGVSVDPYGLNNRNVLWER
jgi:hypothetical protein